MEVIINQINAEENPLVQLLDGAEVGHIGYVYGMSFTEAMVLTNDAWKERVAGIPHNSFLIGAGFDPGNYAHAHELDREVVLLRVLEPAALPSDRDLIKAVVEHNQRRTKEEVFGTDQHDGHDPVTHSELQFGGIKCRILGTFFMQDGHLRLGSDLENYMSCTRLRVFKPSPKALEQIINHVNPEVRAKAEEEAKKAGFAQAPVPLKIGTVRYTSTSRLHRAKPEELVPVYVQPSDFLARRTAVLGMTRTGKSNTVKTQIAATHLAAKRGGVKVGQIIFDVNGEYANATQHDDGSSIANVFADDTVRYRAVEVPNSNFQDLRANFYTEPAAALGLLNSLTKDSQYRKSQGDLQEFLSDSLDEPDATDYSAHNRWALRRAVFLCILHAADYPAPQNFTVRFPVSQGVLTAVATGVPPMPPNDPGVPGSNITLAPAGKAHVSGTLAEVSQWFLDARAINYKQRLLSSSGENWVDTTLESYLNVLARLNSRGNSIYGFRTISPYKAYHSARRQNDIIDEVLGHLKNGKIVILDLSAGPVEIRTVLSERIARRIFEHSMTILNSGVAPPNMVIYVEEAHNLIGRDEDLTHTWPRIAKEGAKARIAFVYATQEPSSIHPNILANTENWYVTHLNNDDELKALSKFYDFVDFKDSLKTAQDVGFARIKTLSSPFVIPTQIDRFTPQKLKDELAEIEAKLAADKAAKGSAPATAAAAAAIAKSAKTVVPQGQA